MESSGEEDFGAVDDEDMVMVATQVEGKVISACSSIESPAYRAPKRRRLTDPKKYATGGSSRENSDDLAGGKRTLHASTQSSDVEEGNESENPGTPIRNRLGCTANGEDETDRPKGKPKSKYRIHIPKKPDILKETLYAQVPRSSQSPYRIRGPYWQNPRSKSPSPPPPVKLHLGPLIEEVKSPVPSSTDVEVALPSRASRRLSIDYDRVQGPAAPKATLCNDSPLLPNDRDPNDLADLPSDAFSSPAAGGTSNQPIEVLSQGQDTTNWHTQFSQRQRLVGPQANLRQTTLFGGQALDGGGSQSQSTRRHNWPLANKEEPPTHHKLDREALKSWVYPTNLGTIRDYQYNIVARGLYHNLLVALPTGLGKTFIAATVMLNWFRWTTDAQIVFVAPTKPLVSQQVEACFNIVGIPRSTTTMLTGGTPPGVRAEEWLTKRVFFMTPQTIINDLKTGICDPKKIVLLVVDEAHRATGSYAYVEVVQFLRRFNTSFRVLALTATPGSSVEGVQEVIDGLGIQRVEIRTEESIDIRQYVHTRKIDTVLFEYSEKMVMVMDLFAKALQPVLTKLNGMNAYWSKDPMMLTPYGCTQARQRWMASDAGRKASHPVKGMVNTMFSLLASLSHAIELLKFHGIGPFFRKITDFRNDTQNGEKGSKYRKQINESEPFQKMMSRVQAWVNNAEFVGHPKLEYLRSVVMNHFLDAGDGRGAADGVPPSSTRIMVFVHYRDSAEEVARVLRRNEPMIRPHVFVGQANSKGSDGMDQKKQLEIIQKFRNGIYNTLVATSIGEEGLDIGEVDLIVCYDASASPIRMLQRMGRTGRKRAGNIVVTLMKGKEENNFLQAKDNYEKMQQMIAAGTRFTFHDEQSPRIVPRDIQPVVDKRVIDIPLENTQSDLPEPRKRAKAPKRPPKKFNMPNGVRTGFTKASRLDDEESETSTDRVGPQRMRAWSLTPEPIPPLDAVLLTALEKQALERNYLDVGGDTPQVVDTPRLDAFPDIQTSLRRTKYVRHGRTTEKMVNMLKSMHNVSKATVEGYARCLRPEDRKDGIAQIEQRVLYFDARRQLPRSPVTRDDSSPNLPSQIMATSSLRGRAGRVDTSKIDPTSTDNEVDGDEEMKDFIDDDLDEDMVVASSASSPPPLTTSVKPFYEPYKNSYAGADSGDDLPEISTLVRKKNNDFTVASTLVEEDTVDVRPRPSQRKGRRLVVEDDSDDG
ncbi:3'-5' DNA helicase [Lignoscripta atroalba]|nr:3'-5' DNA helicase [Lignoscripta atroalba]